MVIFWGVVVVVEWVTRPFKAKEMCVGGNERCGGHLETN